MTDQWYGTLMQIPIALAGFWYVARMFEKALANERQAWQEMVKLQSGVLQEVQRTLTSQVIELRETREVTKEHIEREEHMYSELLSRLAR